MIATGYCDACQAPIEWVFTDLGNRMPVDAEPTPDGNLALTEHHPAQARSATVVGSTIDLFNPADVGVRYRSHFATCPHAGEFRRRR